MPYTRVNLIPQQYIRRAVLTNLLRTWGKIWIALIVISSAIWLQQYLVLKNVALAVDDWEIRSRPARTIREQIHIDKQKIQTLGRELATYEQLDSEQPSLAVMGIVGREVERRQGSLEIRRLSILTSTSQIDSSVRGATHNSDLRTNQRLIPVVRIEGLADSSRTTTDLISGLRVYDLFSDVHLVSTQTSLYHGTPYLSYILECQLKEAP